MTEGEVQTFKCKNPSCKEVVKYLKKSTGGYTLKANVPKRVYLTCEKGHCYPYEVN